MTGPSRASGTVAILGGGIGGLAAATAFARRGAEVTVYEQAKELREVGAGIQITPNGARVLDALGLGEAATARGITARAVEPMDGLSGERVARFDLSALSGPPYRFFHRADLIDILATGARAAGVTLRLGERIESLRPDGAFEDSRGTVRPALTVGADGLNSVARPVLNGADAAFFTGQVAFRCVVPAEDADPVARIWMAPGRHIVTYPVPGGRLNIVAVLERREWTAEGWHLRADPEVLRHAFHKLSGRVTGRLGKAEDVMQWGLFRHPVAKVWTGGGLALLGDAAHPTLPFLAQGANLALEDAWCLAADWADGTLELYGQRRRPRVARAISAANSNAVNYHLGGLRRSVSLTALRGIGTVAPKAFLKRLDWLYGHDVTV
ncbi:FAD-dependent monooxygenase [Roseisalinus antarcticus]|uniref:3-hydroxybenzoate 6-hydroxylase 1 n=1 Tax=Roseisalinus antarcticus TaxID=254357 RepID=A0A1Y5RDU9_9RHOB|nr:FAD-dependent monooxygenase [Roseisalinus antarcticus]SLN13952.1 3-hydroxybenzoate 6-hydroxylase 1 [Roseisalinus antarcticus]